MVNIYSDIGDIAPTIIGLDFDENPPVLFLDSAGQNITVTSDYWDNIRTDQTVYLLLDGQSIAFQQVQPDDLQVYPNAGKPPVFTVSTIYFSAGNRYNIKYKVQDVSNNVFTSAILTFDAKQNIIEKIIKIDITEGAAGYTDDYPYLMPANIAVIRGPAGQHLTARSRGAVRFQDVGGADHCNFYFDENGLSPLALIRIDKIHVDAVGADMPGDQIYLTQKDQTTPLVSKSVVFGEYEQITDPVVKVAIDSVSCNTKGISDGNTICIISIVMNPSYMEKYDDTTIYIQPGSLTVDTTDLYNKNFPVTMAGPNLPTIQIVNGTAEFGVKTDTPGTYTVAFFPKKYGPAYWSKDITFYPLS
ncbi:glyceraldehyde-3-phosphate dehydrogenase [Brucella intermedia]|uniref:glyceraldehyde-3-phosphate dehydrogenase n=1 Tax=Brucella intermedia TaxID=94625 RepID=UPI00124E1751|nr:glyceraldehyde-3-phosphate dehydrogenase [Brucella intermedia]KAB2727605.1 glyceraldehyde-3-phosphate dehydrogenase [Brucella intermedia]